MKLIKEPNVTDFNYTYIPNFLYRRVKFQVKESIIFDIDHGFNFFVRNIIVQAQSFDSLNNYQFAKIDLMTGSGRKLTNGSIFSDGAKISLITSPGDQDVGYINESSPVDLNNFGVSLTAAPLKSVFKINEVFSNSDPLQCRFSWSETPNEDKYLDLLITGYLYPSKGRQWGSKWLY